MKRYHLRGLPLAVACVLLFAGFPCLANVNALDASDSITDTGVYSMSEGVMTGTGSYLVQGDTASTFNEMRDWLGRYKGKDRTLYLTSDITVDTNYQFITNYGDGWGTLTVDTGPYTIYVEGALEIHPRLNFVGYGGVEGIFQVRSGGLLSLADVQVQASDGLTVRQMPSSAFFAHPTPKDVAWGSEPIALPSSALYPKYVPVAVVQVEDGSWEDALPKTVESHLFTNRLDENGEMHDAFLPDELPVEWDTEDFLQQFLDQERFYLTGRYTQGMGTLRESYQPSCLVVFQQAPSVFLYCELNRPSAEVITGLFSFTEPDIPYKIEVSPDGENNWEWVDEAEPSWSIMESYDNGVSQLIFDIGANEERWFRIAFDGEDEPIYSEVVGVRDGEVLPLDIEGGRGGGTDLLPPPGSIAPPKEEDSAKEDTAHGGDTGLSSDKEYEGTGEPSALRGKLTKKEQGEPPVSELSGTVKSTALPKKQVREGLPPHGDSTDNTEPSHVVDMPSSEETSQNSAAQAEAAVIEKVSSQDSSSPITSENSAMQEVTAVASAILPSNNAPLSPKTQTVIGWVLLGGCVAGSGAVFWGAPAISTRLCRCWRKITGKSNTP